MTPSTLSVSSSFSSFLIGMRKLTEINLVLSILLLLILIFSFILSQFHTNPSNFSEHTRNKMALLEQDTETGELKRLLKGAANQDNMVIIAMLDEAQNSVFDLFIESFKVGDGTSRLLNHLVVLALDREAFEHCGALHSHCYFPNRTGDFQGRESTETMMTARQIEFSRQVLELAYSFIYTDLDVMWFRNPLRQFDDLSLLILATDRYRGEQWFWSTANGAFMYVLSASQTIEFFRTWRFATRRYAGGDRSAILTRAVREGTYEFSPKVQFLDTDHFGDVCRRVVDLRVVYTARAAGCCRERGEKLSAMRALAQAWKNYTSLPVEEQGSSSALTARYKCTR